VAARILKHKADLYLGLNMPDTACHFYEQACAATRRENDLYWSLSALEGHLAASYLYVRDLAGQEKASKGFKSSLKRRFSSQKELVVPVEEFSRNYSNLIISYNRSELARFMSLEVAFVAAKLFVQLGMRSETMSFVSYAVYLNNLKLSDEARVIKLTSCQWNQPVHETKSFFSRSAAITRSAESTSFSA